MPNMKLNDVIRAEIEEIYETDFELLIDEFQTLYPHTEIEKNMNQWEACLEFIFTRKLKAVRPMRNQQNAKVPYCQVDFYRNLLDKYISLCRMYNRWINSKGFRILCGLSNGHDFIEMTRNEDRHAATWWLSVIEFLESESSDSLQNKLFDSNNAVGPLSVGNVRHGWSNVYGVGQKEVVQVAQSADDRALRLGLNVGTLEQKTDQKTV